MLGLLRFALAIMVVIGHLSGGVQFFSHWGVFAVFGFYLISGYLITAILNEAYSFQLLPFAANRFLRVFPVYYVVALGSAIVIALAPSASRFHPAWEIKYRLLDLLGNVLIFPFEFYDSAFRLVPPTWSIGVELIDYFLLWLFVARSRKLAFATLFFALAYHVITLAMGLDWGSRYYSFYAALLPFSLGACSYFSRDLLSALPNSAIRQISIFSFFIWVTNLFICGLVAGVGGPYFNLFFYINLASLLLMVSCLTMPSLSLVFRKSGKALGDLAYPVFLTHWIVGFTISLLVLDGKGRSLSLLVISVLPILAISFFVTWLANRWIEPLRNMIRSSARTAQNKPKVPEKIYGATLDQH